MTAVTDDRIRVTKTNLAAAKTHADRVRMIVDAYGGPDKVTTKEVLSLIHGAGVKCARQSVSTALNELRKANDNAAEAAVEEPEAPDPTEDTPEPVKAAEETTEPVKERPKRRWLTVISAALVALVAAIASYEHMRDVALMAGQSDVIAWLLPLSVDGLIVVSSVALADGATKRGIAWLAFLAGSLASLAANIISADPDTLSRAVAAWPAVALLLTVEVLIRKK